MRLQLTQIVNDAVAALGTKHHEPARRAIWPPEQEWAALLREAQVLREKGELWDEPVLIVEENPGEGRLVMKKLVASGCTKSKEKMVRKSSKSKTLVIAVKKKTSSQRPRAGMG